MNIVDILRDIKSGRKKKVILDTDAYNEADDQYALAYCRMSGRIDLAAVNAACPLPTQGAITITHWVKSSATVR